MSRTDLACQLEQGSAASALTSDSAALAANTVKFSLAPDQLVTGSDSLASQLTAGADQVPTHTSAQSPPGRWRGLVVWLGLGMLATLLATSRARSTTVDSYLTGAASG